MSRFSNLEFGEEENEWEKPEALKDEAFYLKEGNAAFYSGRFEEALRSFSKVLEYNPDNAAAWALQVRMLIELGEFREAKLWADKALERFPVEPDLLAVKAVALARMADLDTALAFSDAAIEEKGCTPYVWLARGDVLLARGEKRAEYCFDKAASLEPSCWPLQWLACRICAFYGKFSLAMKYAGQALNQGVDRAIVWLDLGRCQEALGLSAQACNSFEQARQLDALCPGLEIEMLRATHTGIWRKLWRRCRKPFT